MAHIELDRKCFEVTNDDGDIRYGWVIENGDDRWIALSASPRIERQIVGFYNKPREAFHALVEIERGEPWAVNDES